MIQLLVALSLVSVEANGGVVHYVGGEVIPAAGVSVRAQTETGWSVGGFFSTTAPRSADPLNLIGGEVAHSWPTRFRNLELSPGAGIRAGAMNGRHGFAGGFTRLTAAHGRYTLGGSLGLNRSMGGADPLEWIDPRLEFSIRF